MSTENHNSSTVGQSPNENNPKRITDDKVKFLRENLSKAPIAMAWFDLNMRYLFATDRWIKDYKLPDKDLIGKLHYDIFPEITEELKLIHRRSMEGEILSGNEYPFLRLDGRTDFVSWIVMPWRDRKGIIGGIDILSEVLPAKSQDNNSNESSALSKDDLRSMIPSVSQVETDIKNLRSDLSTVESLLNEFMLKFDPNNSNQNIAKNEFFKSSPPDELNLDQKQKMLEEFPAVHLKEGAEVYVTGQKIGHVVYVVSGLVRTNKIDPSGKELTMVIYGPGDLVGIEDWFTDRLFSNNLLVLQDASLILIPSQSFQNLFSSGSLFQNWINHQMALEIRRKNEQLINLAYSDLRGKVAFSFLRLENVCKRVDGQNVEIQITRKLLSTIAGVAKESLIRTIIDFIEEGLIEENENGFKILDHKKLERLVS